MRKITSFFIFILCLNLNCIAKNGVVWENPAYLYSNVSYTTVSSVCFSDTATVVKLLATKPRSNMKFVSDTYLLGDSGRKYMVRRCNEYPLDRYMPVAKKDKAIITLVFDPMPRGQKSIDLIEGYGDMNFKILGIHMADKPLKVKEYAHHDKALANLRKSFFTADSVCVKGRFERIPKERTGVIYRSDILTDKDYPTTVFIDDDGTFERKFKIEHPEENYIWINNSIIPFFVIPGHTIDITVHKNGSIDYKDEYGKDAVCSRYLKSPLQNLRVYDQFEMMKDIKSMTFKEFGEKIDKKLTEVQTLADYMAARLAFSSADYALARMSLQVNCVRMLFDYKLEMHSSKDYDRLEGIKILENYSALKKVPVYDPIILSTNGYKYLQNRYSFMHPIIYAKYSINEDGSYVERDFPQRIDSIIDIDRYLFNQDKQSLLVKVHFLNDLQRCLDSDWDQERKEQAYNAVRAIFNDQIWLDKIDRMYKHCLDTKDFTYVLADGAATSSLQKITDRFKGRYVFIDFWSTGCGPCRMNIERTKEARSILRKNPDVAFIFLTSEAESPEHAYKDYVAENLSDDYCYRVPEKEYLSYRELFQFNGIPHYEVLDRQGNVIRIDGYWYDVESFNKILETIKARLEK